MWPSLSLSHTHTQATIKIADELTCDPLSLSLSLTLKHAHTHTHTEVKIADVLRCDPVSLVLSLSLSLSHTHTHTRTHTRATVNSKYLKHTVAGSKAPDCHCKVRITSSPRFTKRLFIKCVSVHSFSLKLLFQHYYSYWNHALCTYFHIGT